MSKHTFEPLPSGSVHLLPGELRRRRDANRRYLTALRTENLLQNHYLEAGLWSPRVRGDWHGGWELPTCQLRGHFLGHWLSAAARTYANTGDLELKGKADHIVAELGRCQRENGGEWVGSIPEKYLDWVARGKGVWAPHYTLHKTLMGLYEMAAYAGNEQALEIMVRWADWFLRWTAPFSREEMDDILDVETGGMLEAWANLYGLTGREEHLELMRRYDRPRLFEPLLAGEDPLTNHHANTTIPEAHGAARAWEVTGEQRWRDIAEAYWDCAVTRRAAYCTGGQTCGEFWTPPGDLSARLGDKNQEHCTVYNMMRLAEYLLRWTGETRYADYWERNLVNGILAQQHPETGMVAYFLPLRAGSVKVWGTPAEDFWCCHGSLVQAHTLYENHVGYETGEGLAISQAIPCDMAWERDGAAVQVRLTLDPQLASTRRPHSTAFDLHVCCDAPRAFTLALRLPWWVSGTPAITVNGERQPVRERKKAWVPLRRTWQDDRVHVDLPRRLSPCPLPDMPGMVAFMDGPEALAGLCDGDITLYGDSDRPETMLTPDNEREWGNWLTGYRTYNQARNIRLIPLHRVRDERYTVYFSVKSS